MRYAVGRVGRRWPGSSPVPNVRGMTGAKTQPCPSCYGSSAATSTCCATALPALQVFLKTRDPARGLACVYLVQALVVAEQAANAQEAAECI